MTSPAEAALEMAREMHGIVIKSIAIGERAEAADKRIAGAILRAQIGALEKAWPSVNAAASWDDCASGPMEEWLANTLGDLRAALDELEARDG